MIALRFPPMLPTLALVPSAVVLASMLTVGSSDSLVDRVYSKLLPAVAVVFIIYQVCIRTL